MYRKMRKIYVLETEGSNGLQERGNDIIGSTLGSLHFNRVATQFFFKIAVHSSTFSSTFFKLAVHSAAESQYIAVHFAVHFLNLQYTQQLNRSTYQYIFIS